MGKFFVFLLLATSALILNSCVFVNTHRAVADCGQQCQAVIIPDQENLTIYRHHGKLYLQGVLTSVRRTGRDKISNYIVNDFSSGQYRPIPGAPQCYVYRELGPADIIENDSFSLVPGKQIPKEAAPLRHHRQTTGYTIDSLNCNPVTTHLQYGWQRELPRYAKPARLNMVTSGHQQVGSHLCNTRYGFIIPVTPARANKRAWYAYPLAGVSLVLVDVPGTVLANTVVPVVYGVAAIPCSIYETGKRILVTPRK